jgi:hypothetical protein
MTQRSDLSTALTLQSPAGLRFEWPEEEAISYVPQGLMGNTQRGANVLVSSAAAAASLNLSTDNAASIVKLFATANALTES